MGPAAIAAVRALAGLCGLATLGLVARGTSGPVRGIKVLPALLLAATCPDGVRAAGFVLYAAGDAFLLDKRRLFLAGLAAFLAGHLLVVASLVRAGDASPAAAAVGAVAAVALTGALWRGLSRTLRYAVPVYAAALVALLAAAAGDGPLPTAGAVLFLVSDAVLAWNRFRAPVPGGELVVLSTYYLAIGLLA